MSSLNSESIVPIVLGVLGAIVYICYLVYKYRSKLLEHCGNVLPICNNCVRHSASSATPPTVPIQLTLLQPQRSQRSRERRILNGSAHLDLRTGTYYDNFDNTRLVRQSVNGVRVPADVVIRGDNAALRRSRIPTINSNGSLEYSERSFLSVSFVDPLPAPAREESFQSFDSTAPVHGLRHDPSQFESASTLPLYPTPPPEYRSKTDVNATIHEPV